MIQPIKINGIKFDAFAIYTAAKLMFVADYCHDAAVMDQVYQNGDIAEMHYADSIKALSPARFASASREEIEACMQISARMALCNLISASRKRAQATRRS